MNTITVGNQAPSFTLVNTEKKEISLSNFEGKALLILFFPMAFTSVCTAELCSVRDNFDMYNNAGVDVVGISVDSPFTLAKFKEEQNLNFDLLSDFNKEVSQAYGAFYDNFVLGLKGVSKRAAFLVNKEGNIVYAEVLDNAGEQPNFEKIKEAISSL